MGRNRRFLRFFATFACAVFMAFDAFAAGYVCEVTKTYTSCNTGYYFDNGDCISCTTISNTAEISSETEEITGGTRTTTITCNGTMNEGAGGTNGKETCSGCSTSDYEWRCECNDGWQVTGEGSSCGCCNTKQTCPSGYNGTYNACTGDGTNECYTTCEIACSGNDTSSCPTGAACQYDTEYKETGTKWYGSTTCEGQTPLCPLKEGSVVCGQNTYLDNGSCVTCNVSFTDSKTDTEDITNGTRTRTNTRTCYKKNSDAGSTSADSCTWSGNDSDCDTWSYGEWTYSCNNGYEQNGDSCVCSITCADTPNTQSTQSCTPNNTVTGAKTTDCPEGTQTCAGNYTGNACSSAGAQCTGCTEWGACSTSCYATSCVEGYYLDNGECKLASNLGDGYTCPDGNKGASECYKSCTIECTAQTKPSNVHTWTSNGETSTGKMYYGKQTCEGTAKECTYTINTCSAEYYLEDGACKPAPDGYICDEGTVGKNNCYINCGDKTGYTVASNKAYHPNKCSYTANTYTVKYNANKPDGASGSVSGSTTDSSHDYDTAKALTSNGYSLTGWTFNGWNTAANGTGTSYADKANVENLTDVQDGSVTLYAQWTANPYTVTYDSNKPASASGNVSGSTADSNHTYDTAKTLTSNGYSLTGWTFNGWNTAANGTGTSYANGASVTKLATSGTTTLYAQWTANTISLSWNNGGRGTAPTAPASCKYDSTFTMPSAMTATGYTFGKWSVNDKTFDVDEEVTCNYTNLGVYSGTATITGTWTANTYKVTYSCGDGSGTVPSQATATYDDANFTPATNTCTRDGYTFAGWAVSGTNDIKPENKAFTWKYTENKTFTAQWTVNGANTITYDTVDGEIKDTSYTQSCNAATETFTLPTNVVKAGSTFAGWKDASGKIVSTVAKGTCTSALTFTATWTPCDVVDDGECNCATGTYPVGGVCTSCVTSCAGIADYTLGNYNICSDATAQACYRNCATSDVENSATVSGTVTKGGQKDCVATKCVGTHYLDNGACKSCPDNATCDGSGNWTCTNGYTKSGTTCKANTYEVTLNANGGTGGTATVTATFGQKLPAATMPTLVNNAFQGYYDASGVQYYDASGTPVKEWITAGNGTLTAKWKTTGLACQAGYYYDGNDHQECKEGWYCPGTGNATIGTAGCYTECPSEYPNSVAGATEEGQCYVECTTECVEPSGCPENSLNCKYLSSVVDGRIYSGTTTCTADESNRYCRVDYRNLLCNVNYYHNQDTENPKCLYCGDLGEGYMSAGGKYTQGTSACYKTCDYHCPLTNGQPPKCPDNTEYCEWEDPVLESNGFTKYPGEVCTEGVITCEMLWDCKVGYTADTDNTQCVANVYTVTMNDNGGSGGDGTIYQKYKTGWYTDAAAANTLTTVAIPQRQYFTFTGYYTTQTALENPQQIFSATGELTEVGQNADFTTDTTLYAWWSQDVFLCEVGKDASGNTCPEGSYCGGWEVNAGTETSTTSGCARTCPSDARGGTISAVAGATSKTQCYAVLTDVTLSDKSGSGDETCYWNDNTAAYAQGCTIAVKSCIAGHFREAENSQTCAKVGQKAYSPDGSIEKFLCSALTGANSTINTATDVSGAATDCYNTCSDIDIQNGVRDTVNDKEYYNGTNIPACTYTTVCNTGYQASGEECSPKIFKIELNHDGGTSSVNAIYLKYATGWYSDVSASNSITSVQLPTKAGGYTCFGYMSDGNDIVIGADGVLNKDFELFKDNATITAIWEQNDSITCDAGSYYTGTGAACTTCPVGSYCPGVTTFQDINEVKGLNSCESLGGTYVAAKDIDDKEMTVTVTSVKGAASAGECYATNVEYVPSSRLGAGSQTCYFNTATTAYTANCKDETIVMCNAGHYLVSPTDIDCTPVGIGYYSAEKILTRTACPNLFDGIGVSTVGETSDKITLCYLGDKWEAANAEHEFSDHRLNCYHIDDVNDNNPDTGYSNNCNVPVIVTCAAGYYDDGVYINSNSKRDCVPVGLNAYSPEQAYFADEPAEPLSKTPGSSTKRYECPDGGVTGDATMSDRPSDCYKEKVSCSVNNGSGEYTCNYDDVAGNYSKDCTECVITGCAEGYIQIGDECTDCPADYVCGDNQKRTCAVATGGTHTKSDAGTLDAAYCYRDCVNTGSAAQMSGRDYYGESVADTCKIEACAAGYTLSNNQCVQCPENYVCTPDNPAPQSCATLTNGTHTMSAKGSDDVKDCYVACEEYDVVNGKAVPLEPKAFYPKQCEFKGISDTGNPCDIIDGVCVETACQYNFEMIDGVCTPCNRDHAISYKPTGNCMVESCATGYHPNGQYCDESKKSCEAPNAVSAYQEWSDKNGAFGPCIVTKCEAGYHVAANACQTDEQVCELEHGIGVREWDTVAKAWGKCVATKCDPGYTNDPSQTNELWEQCGRCNNMYSANGDLAASTYVDECEIASCMYQGQKYALENNECVFICKTITEADDETGTQYWDEATKKCVRQCSPGYTAW